MPTPLGAHNPRIAFARELLTKKGRKAHARFAFEGPTLLHEALEAGAHVESVFVTAGEYDDASAVARAEARGAAVYAVDERTMQRISDLETPSGIVAIAPLQLEPAASLFQAPGIVLALADVSDPGNAGTLLRSAEAFGIQRVVFGSRGAEPHLPKVVRSAMGALFRVRLAVASADEIAQHVSNWQVTGLTSEGEPLSGLKWAVRSLLLVGSERRGLGTWQRLCTRFAAIPMRGDAESLNAAIAGSIALYEAAKQSFS